MMEDQRGSTSIEVHLAMDVTSSLQTLLSGKTPISFLEEVCTKKKISVSYHVLANEGPVHEPVFVIQAEAGGFKGSGRGFSKKKAKHSAAEDLLCTMFGVSTKDVKDEPSCDRIPPEDTNEGILPTASSKLTGMFDGDMLGNPIGELQEYTQKNLLKPPLYDYVGEEGPPHAREFVCTVKLGKLQETGVGKSKKVAKRAAANKLLQTVRQHHNDTSSSAVMEEDDEDFTIVAALDSHNSVKSHTRKVQTLEAGKQATVFFKHFDRGAGSKADSVKSLYDFASVSKIDVSYLDIQCESYSGQHQCIVQISTTPIAVCYGTGFDTLDARRSAAFNALTYLNLVACNSR